MCIGEYCKHTHTHIGSYTHTNIEQGWQAFYNTKPKKNKKTATTTIPEPKHTTDKTEASKS